MCGKGEVPYIQKYLCGCTVIMVAIIIILSMVINFGGESGAQVEMSGDNESTLVEQSSGIHLLEVNGADLGSIGGNNWSWMEILCVVLGFSARIGINCFAYINVHSEAIKAYK